MILKKGDEIRVLALSKSMSVLTNEQIDLAKKKIESMGFKVTFGKHVFECDDLYGCASIESRLEDFHEAIKDKNVKCILAARGGYNVNQILDRINYDLVKNNPKVICGFSDITALLNAVYAKTGIITFSGPIYSNFGMKKGFDYTETAFQKIMLDDNPIEIESSDYYSDDKWYKDQENRVFIKNSGMKVINEGECKGIIIGGNLCTLNLLQGTQYMPKLKDSILFIEDDDASGKNFLLEFDRNIESIIQMDDFKYVKGIVIGRAQTKSEMNDEKWKVLVKSKEKLRNIPIIINADFGHTTPIFTFPIGGKCTIDALNGNLKIIIEK